MHPGMHPLMIPLAASPRAYFLHNKSTRAVCTHSPPPSQNCRAAAADAARAGSSVGRVAAPRTPSQRPATRKEPAPSKRALAAVPSANQARAPSRCRRAACGASGARAASMQKDRSVSLHHHPRSVHPPHHRSPAPARTAHAAPLWTRSTRASLAGAQTQHDRVKAV